MWDLSYPTMDPTYIPCIARQIFNHWTTRKSLNYLQIKSDYVNENNKVLWGKISPILDRMATESLSEEATP